ncbi:hypothetical protein [Aliiglaciecola sp. LCG003]|uniref:hypothetical protein n=1 Tax=Aliiglaciecola sp. LCG003 TaxID=3053655 RepID=UPI0033658501
MEVNVQIQYTPKTLDICHSACTWIFLEIACAMQNVYGDRSMNDLYDLTELFRAAGKH